MNGYLKGDFYSGRGLRQGDPMAPYLFLLVMEAFSGLLKANTVNSDFQYHDRCERPQITHVCFADDLFILSRADVASVGL